MAKSLSKQAVKARIASQEDKVREALKAGRPFGKYDSLAVQRLLQVIRKSRLSQ